ncbi:serine/threonine-protein phosphatase [Nocardioides seonyuensis]|uniref:Serine/threonine-protein phosphatase n=1 Tax=Nocardioides seonyuensis TaxID=2518371 RepID=A0A4P7IDR9_9ACTN|nr:protein phosphatase 2C domain-containing protein [Nocardioides seonyuensis]QBX55316.1 serine/threonine-protein phosphatase [Nocardioides seonyuensis]
MTFHLHYSAISDVGRVRRDNQDSGYAGPWLLTVCDGVGGAVRGDLASSTAVQQLRKLDQPPADDLLGQVAGAIHRADDRIAELVEEDPALSGTSTTLTVALFDGEKLAMGHLGDSRAYLLREGEISQLTQDHTFVQTLIDEGRITEEESRTHPHRNLILKALDGIRHEEPDLFEVPLQLGDRVLVCSDGASGVLSPERMADILGSGTPDFAAVELVRASLEAGSTDNVTCVVAEVSGTEPDATLQPLLVGAAADLPRRAPLAGAGRGLFRGHRSGDTGEIEPVTDVELGEDIPAGAIPADPIDPEAARYAPRPPSQHTGLRRLLAALVLLGLAWIALAVAWSWSQQQFYVAEHDGRVTIFRGLNADLPGIELSHPYETTDVEMAALSDIEGEQVREGLEADNLADAHTIVDNYAARQASG